MSTELEIKSVNDGIAAFDKIFNTIGRKKITFDKTAFVTDVQNLYEQTLAACHNTWNEIGLAGFEDIGRCTAISCGELAAIYCCNNLGVSRINTESLILLYNTLGYYLKARTDAEKGIANNMQLSIIKNMRFCGVTQVELDEVYNIVLYSDFCRWFELNDLNGYNVCDSLLDYMCKLSKCNFMPEWKIQANGQIYSKRSAILTDARFLWYYAPKNADIYVYRPDTYCFQQMLRFSNNILKKMGVSEKAANDALLYIGVTSQVLGRYADTACAGVPQYYTGILHDAIVAQAKKKKNFYQMFYVENVQPRIKAHMGAVANHLQTVPGVRIYCLTDKYMAFTVPKGTDLSNQLTKDILADVSSVRRIEDMKEFYGDILINVYK